MQDALGLTSDQVYCWRLLLEEYGPSFVYIKGIHKTVADAFSQPDYRSIIGDRSSLMIVAQYCCKPFKLVRILVGIMVCLLVVSKVTFYELISTA